MQTSGVLSILYLVYRSCDLATQERSNCAGLETQLEEFCYHDLRPLDISDCLIGTDPGAESNGVGIINISKSDILPTIIWIVTTMSSMCLLPMPILSQFGEFNLLSRDV